VTPPLTRAQTRSLLWNYIDRRGREADRKKMFRALELLKVADWRSWDLLHDLYRLHHPIGDRREEELAVEKLAVCIECVTAEWRGRRPVARIAAETRPG
jgi:hypothetical protein